MRRQISCRKAAVFSDIHSNYHAFRACYEDALSQGADCFLFLGDYISDLADPVKTLDLVYQIRTQYPTICLRGNREGYMLSCQDGLTRFSRGSKTGSLLYTFEQLRPQDFEFFRSLPIYDVIELNGLPIELAHATKENDRHYFDAADGRIRTVFGSMEHSLLLTGHSHKQYTQSDCGKTVLNPGSIGVPQGGSPRPRYALLEVEDGKPSFQFRQVPYDVTDTIRAQFENGLVDYAKYWAVSVLYDIITGEDYTMELLNRVHKYADGSQSAIHDEKLWHTTAADMGMKFTRQEILDFCAAVAGSLEK